MRLSAPPMKTINIAGAGDSPHENQKISFGEDENGRSRSVPDAFAVVVSSLWSRGCFEAESHTITRYQAREWSQPTTRNRSKIKSYQTKEKEPREKIACSILLTKTMSAFCHFCILIFTESRATPHRTPLLGQGEIRLYSWYHPSDKLHGDGMEFGCIGWYFG